MLYEVLHFAFRAAVLEALIHRLIRNRLSLVPLLPTVVSVLTLPDKLYDKVISPVAIPTGIGEVIDRNFVPIDLKII